MDRTATIPLGLKSASRAAPWSARSLVSSAAPGRSRAWSLHDGHIHFVVPPQFESRKSDLDFEGTLDGNMIHGKTTDDDGKHVAWTGRRAPSLKRDKPPTWGKPIALFDGKDLNGWKPRSHNEKNQWEARAGVLVSPASGTDLVTDRKFTDFKLHAEFRYPKGSNSGVYLHGRYEVQIVDDYGEAADSHGSGGIYGFLTPSVNAAKKPGEWQTLDVTLVGRVGHGRNERRARDRPADHPWHYGRRLG